MWQVINQMMRVGYTADMILSFISKKFQHIVPQIASARKSGYDAAAILKYLSTKVPRQNEELADKSANSMQKYMSSFGFKNKEERQDQRNRVLKTALNVGAGALAAYGLNKTFASLTNPQSPAPTLAQGVPTPPVSPQNPPSPANPTVPNPPSHPQAPNPITGLFRPIGGGPNQPPASTGSAAIPQHVVAPTQPVVSDALQQMGLADRVKTMLSAGNTPEVISSALQQQLTPGQKKWMKENNVDLTQAVSEYIKSVPTQQSPQPSQDQVATAGKTIPEPSQDHIPDATKMVQEAPTEAKPEPGKQVALPDGNVGTIEQVKDKVIRINENGKIRHVKISDIVMEPEEVVNFANEVAKIPESERSSNINSVYYLPHKKTLLVKFRGDNKIYDYDDVSHDDFQAISKGQAIPKTSGKTTTGEVWEATTPGSYGAALIQRIISNPKYSKDNKGKTWGVGEVGYNILKALDVKPKVVKSEEKAPRKKKTKTRPIAG